MLFNGFGFSGYRSFGDELAKISPLKKVNLIIGQNNSGKSNIIKFLSEQYAYFQSKALRPGSVKDTFDNELDRHKSDNQTHHRIAFPLLKGDIDDHINSLLPDEPPNRKARRYARALLTSDVLADDNAVWFVFKSNSPTGNFELEFDVDQVEQLLESNEWLHFFNTLIGQAARGNALRDLIPQILIRIAYKPTSAPKVITIPAIRKIGESGSHQTDYSGEGAYSGPR